jgi:YggT family protein
VSAVHVVADVVYFALLVFLLLLVFRLIMEYVFLLARSYRPAGFVAVVLELAYTITDPPLKALRRVIPPLRIGSVSLDLGFLILFIVVRILMGVVAGQRG